MSRLELLGYVLPVVVVDEVLKVLDGKLLIHGDAMDVDPGKVHDQSGSKIRTFGNTMMCLVTQIK